MGLYVPEDPQRNKVSLFPYESLDLNVIEYINCNNNKFLKKRSMTAIVIKIPMEELDEIAEREEIETPITESDMNIIVKIPFNRKKASLFNSFNAVEQ